MAKHQSVIEGWRGVCVAMGLGTPLPRGLCAGLLAGTVMYSLKYPRAAFRADGSLKPIKQAGTRSADAVEWNQHFLLTPLAVAGLVCLAT